MTQLTGTKQRLSAWRRMLGTLNCVCMAFKISDHRHTQDQHMASAKTTFLFPLNLSQNESIPKTKHPEPRTAGWCNPPALWGLHRSGLGRTKQLLHKNMALHQRAKAVILHLKGKVRMFRLGQQKTNWCKGQRSHLCQMGKNTSEQRGWSQSQKVLGSMPSSNRVELACLCHVGFL